MITLRIFGHWLLLMLLTVWNGSLAPAQEPWTSLFDGQTLNGWERVGDEKSVWEVRDGAICGSGEASMLVSTHGPFTNFRYRAEIKINDGGNSGLYFRTKPRPGFLDGYEAQIDSTHSDPIRTGSLYGLCHVYKQLVKPDTWFTYELEVRDDVWRKKNVTRIKVSVNGEELYEYLDFQNLFGSGHFAFQQHDPKSEVAIRKVEVQPLDDKPVRNSNQENKMKLGNFSVSLTVKDLKVSQAFYEKLGFRQVAGNPAQNWVILQNDQATVGLFQGMFEKNILTFNPGWDRNSQTLPEFDDVRDIQRHLKSQGIELLSAADEASTGPASVVLVDPDGNQILIDQHVEKPKK